MTYMEKANRPSLFNAEECINGVWVKTHEDIGLDAWILLLKKKPKHLRAVDRDGNIIIAPNDRPQVHNIA